jgi:hypothetical protein
VPQRWRQPSILALAWLALILAAGCTTARGPSFERQKMIMDLADALREEALSLPQDAQRERLVSGLIQLRELMMTETILKPVEEPPGGPSLPTPEGSTKSDPAWTAMFSPRSVVIGFFTKAKAFGGQEDDQGLEVRLQPLDQFGDPTKAVGCYRIEVFEYRALSGEKRGNRLGHWFVKVLDAASQRRYYDRVDRCYVFPLLWEKGVVPGRAVIVQATYYPPGGFQEKLFAQRLIKLEEAEE